MTLEQDATSSEPRAPATPNEPNGPNEPNAPNEPNEPNEPAGPAFRDRTIPASSFGTAIGFRTRLTFALIAAAVIPLAVFGLLLIAALRLPDPISTVPRLLLLFVTLVALIAVLVAYLLAADLTAPLRAIAAAVDRVSAGDLSTPINVGGDDELSRLAESHNRLAAGPRAAQPRARTDPLGDRARLAPRRGRVPRRARIGRRPGRLRHDRRADPAGRSVHRPRRRRDPGRAPARPGRGPGRR